MRVLSPIINRLLSAPFRTIVIDDQRAWKGYQMYLGALHLARAIEKASNRPQVGIMLPTAGIFPMAMIASWMLGRTVVPLNYLLKGEDLEYVIDDAELDLVITARPMLDRFGPLPEKIGKLCIDEMQFKGLPPLRRSTRRAEDFLAVLMYTSGTSGRPKGVMLSSENLTTHSRLCIDWAGFTRKDVMLGVLPQVHSFGLTVLTVLPMAVGCKVVYTARFMPKKILGLLREHRPTAFIGIPSMFNALLAAKSARAEDFASLRYVVSGSEPLPEAVFNGFRDRFNITINEGYGLTETSPATNWCRPQDHKHRSVGMPLPGVREKIVDSHGRTLGVDEEGEILISGPNVMQGYYKMPRETEAVFDEEGYFRTGDMGRIDADGHLFITGRIKEMLIIGGENVFPREIEEALISHPSVHACAVIGMKDESRGELPLAFIELADDAEFDETALRSHCRERIAQYKVPREIRVLKELPRNPTGKILRRELSPDVQSIIK